MKRYALALDLKDDPAVIAGYEAQHKAVWPAIQESILSTGILSMQLYRVANRLFMLIEAEDWFTFEDKAAADAANETVQRWEALMSTYQQAIPGVESDGKWALMEQIYELRQ